MRYSVASANCGWLILKRRDLASEREKSGNTYNPRTIQNTSPVLVYDRARTWTWKRFRTCSSKEQSSSIDWLDGRRNFSDIGRISLIRFRACSMAMMVPVIDTWFDLIPLGSRLLSGKWICVSVMVMILWIWFPCLPMQCAWSVNGISIFNVARSILTVWGLFLWWIDEKMSNADWYI